MPINNDIPNVQGHMEVNRNAQHNLRAITIHKKLELYTKHIGGMPEFDGRMQIRTAIKVSSDFLRYISTSVRIR